MLINEGKWDKVADEYLNRTDYKNCERDELREFKLRLDWNADIFRKYAEELKSACNLEMSSIRTEDY